MTDPCKYPVEGSQIEKLWERTDESRSRLDKVEIELRFYRQAVQDTQKAVDRIDTKLESLKAEIRGDIKELAASISSNQVKMTKAEGAAGALDWIAQRWMSLAALLAAAIAFVKSGGQ